MRGRVCLQQKFLVTQQRYVTPVVLDDVSRRVVKLASDVVISHTLSPSLDYSDLFQKQTDETRPS